MVPSLLAALGTRIQSDIVGFGRSCREKFVPGPCLAQKKSNPLWLLHSWVSLSPSRLGRQRPVSSRRDEPRILNGTQQCATTGVWRVPTPEHAQRIYRIFPDLSHFSAGSLPSKFPLGWVDNRLPSLCILDLGGIAGELTDGFSTRYNSSK